LDLLDALVLECSRDRGVHDHSARFIVALLTNGKIAKADLNSPAGRVVYPRRRSNAKLFEIMLKSPESEGSLQSVAVEPDGHFLGPGPVVAGGMVYILSGNGRFVGSPGNVLLAFEVD
jgi:hypothetical protein